MALAASRTLLALFITFCAPGCGWTAEKPPRTHNGKQTSMDKALRESWEPSIHLDGRPVDRFTISSGKPSRSHRFAKGAKDSRSAHLLEDVDPEWVNLDGFAVLGGAPVNNSSAGPLRFPHTPPRSQPSFRRAPRVDRTTRQSGVPHTRTQRRAPQSSSGPRQPERVVPRTPLLQRRYPHHTKPQSDQRNRNGHKLASESVHVVSLQAQKSTGQSASASRAGATKTTTPEPPEYEARDISVRVMSPQSVLISWVDPAVELGKVEPGASRSYSVRYREKGESARWEYKESTQRRLMIDTLSADGMYEFSVRISQGEKQSKWSVSVFQRTPESAPSGPPENFEVKPLRGKGTAVIATWDPPEEPNGRIREYILSYAPAMKPFGMKSTTYRGSTTTATVDGLTPGDRYIFKIRATNRRGQGPQSKVFSVAMPGSSSSASSKAKESLRTSHIPTEQDTDRDEADLSTTEAPDETTTTTTTPPPRAAAPVNRRGRPLSQSRSYHTSIFSAARGSVRNTGNRGTFRGRSQDKEEPAPTTPPPVKETTTAKQPDNDVSLEFEDDYDEETPATERPSLKVVTPSPTKPLPTPPKPQPRRPIKIRVHEKPMSKASPSPRSSSPSSSNTQESAASRKDYIAATYPKSKDGMTYDKPSIPLAKDSDSVGRGRLGSPRPGIVYGQRQPGVLLRGNSTRLPNGYKPAMTSQSSLPGRTPNQATSNARPSVMSADRTQSHETSKSAAGRASSSQTTSDARQPDRWQGGSRQPSTAAPPRFSPSTPHTHRSQASPENTEVTRGEEERTAVSRARLSPSLLERFPWLANRNLGRSSAGSRTSLPRQDGRIPWTRTSASVGGSRPISRGMPTRVSGASGAAGVSTIQETSEDVRTAHDSLKHEVGAGSAKPTSAGRNADTRTASPSGGHRDSRRGYDGNDSTEDYDNEGSRRGNDRNDKAVEPTPAQRTPPSDPRDNESVDTGTDTSSRTRAGSSIGANPSVRRPGLNGRVRPPLLANRQFGGGSRFPIRPAQNSPDRESEAGGSSQSTLPSSSSSSSSRDSLRGQGGRFRYPINRGKPVNGGAAPNGNAKNGRPNLTTTGDKESTPSLGTNKAVGQKFITGPDGSKWVIDLARGILMNQEGRILQDSSGKPKRVVLGEDGRTIFDHMGSPLLNQEGMALFGHGRDSRPVVNPKDKLLTVGGKPLLGLDLPRSRTPVKPRTTTTTTTTTTTMAPTTTTPEPTTPEVTTPMPFPTCPPGTYSKTDEFGFPLLDLEGILDCYPEEESSGLEMDYMVSETMLPDALAQDELLIPTTLPPPLRPTTTAEPSSNRGPSSEFDLSGRKRFTAPYVNYIQKDPAAPCSLTEALEFVQVEVLEGLMERDGPAANQNQPPKQKPQNLTVVAMEGCHSFIILDWARPLKDDMVSGYMVHSASYDDVLNNRWSSSAASGTHLAVENLKPNSRYYFKVQAKNVFGLGPVSDTLTYVTESDDPLLIERPPGGEPIWIPFTFKYNSAHSSCKGSQFVKRTWYRKFVGVVLCNSLRYKIFMGDGLREPFYSIGDTMGQGEDHCQFVDSYRDGRTGPSYLSNHLPSAQGYFRAYRQEPVNFGVIGRRTPHPFVGWYECGVPIPGKW